MLVNGKFIYVLFRIIEIFAEANDLFTMQKERLIKIQTTIL